MALKFTLEEEEAMEFTVSTLVCANTKKEKVLELIDYFTLQGEIVMLSCFNIIDEISIDEASYLEMDKEKIGVSNKLVVFGKRPLAIPYINVLVEYAKKSGKNIQFVNN